MPALRIKRLRCSQSRRPAKPNLPPIGKFAARASTKGDTGASTKRAFQKHGVAELPHLSRAIHDYLVDLLLHPMLLATQEAHGRRKIQSAIMRTLIQRLG